MDVISLRILVYFLRSTTSNVYHLGTYLMGGHTTTQIYRDRHFWFN